MDEDHLDFDTLFFDWGGASCGNSLLETFVKRIMNHATEHPSKMYVVVSNFSSRAFEDASDEFGIDIPANLFLRIEKYIDFEGHGIIEEEPLLFGCVDEEEPVVENPKKKGKWGRRISVVIQEEGGDSWEETYRVPKTEWVGDREVDLTVEKYLDDMLAYFHRSLKPDEKKRSWTSFEKLYGPANN